MERVRRRILVPAAVGAFRRWRMDVRVVHLVALNRV